jgi:hypothetical protein
MTDNAEITAVEIARLAGVGRAAVSNWRKRHADFPQPVGGTASKPTFRLADVEIWLKANDKAADLPADETAWQQVRTMFPEHDLPDGVALAGALIMSMESYESPSQQRLGAQALLAEPDPDRIVTGIREAMDKLPLVEVGSPQAIDDRHASLLRVLANLVVEEGPAKAFDLLVDRMHDATRLPRLPGSVAALMVSLIGETPDRTYDPACGTGPLLTAALERFPKTLVFGDETSGALLDIATLRCLARQPAGGRFRHGGLRDPWSELVAADAVLCVPPYGERDWGAEELAYDPRWRYGVPPRAEPELAWIQHAVANLRPGGRAVMLMPPAVAARPSGRRIRAELLRAGALQAVVGLPAGSAPPHSLGLHLWILTNPSSSAVTGRVLVAEVAGRIDGHRPDGAEQFWATHTHVLVATLAAFEEGADLPESPDVVARVFRVMDVLDEDVDLSPARRLHTEPAPMDAEDILLLHQGLTKQLRRLPGLTPQLSVPDVRPTVPSITVADLAKSGAITTIMRAITRMDGLAAEPGPETVPVWTAKDVAAGGGPSAHLADSRIPSDAVQVREGDIVVPVSGPQLVARVAGAAEEGALLGAHLFLVRPDAGLLDSWFLAGFLKREANTHRASSLGSMQRFDIRRAQVPRIPVEQQRRYGLLLRQLAEFDTLLRHAALAGGDLIKVVTDGLANGTIQPPVSTTEPSTAMKGQR